MPEAVRCIRPPKVLGYIGIKIEPDCCVGKPKAKGGLMHLTAEGCMPEAVSCIRPPKALYFPTQLPGEILMAVIA